MTDWKIIQGDVLEILDDLNDESFDGCFCDPPYGLSDEDPDMDKVLRAWMEGEEYSPGTGGFMGKCVHPDTDVLTKEGWKNVTDITTNDQVCSLNPETHDIEYVSVDKLHKYSFEGDLLRVGGRSVEQVVTPNHEVYVKTNNKSRPWEKRRADNLTQTFYLKNQGKWSGKHTDTIEVNGKQYPSKEFFRVFGLFLGDGYTCVRENQPEKGDFWGFSVKKDYKKKAVQSSLNELRNRQGFWVFRNCV